MTTGLLVVLAIALGAVLRTRRSLLFPLLISVVLLFALAIGGHDVSDTPIPFLAVMTTIAMALGIALATRQRGKSAGAAAPPPGCPTQSGGA